MQQSEFVTKSFGV